MHKERQAGHACCALKRNGSTSFGGRWQGADRQSLTWMMMPSLCKHGTASHHA